MRDDLVSYLITDPEYYSNKKADFKSNLKKVLKLHKVNMACFRDKTSDNFNELAKIFVETCKKNNVENILINSDYKLAKELGATGVHLTSQQFKEIKNAKELDLYVVISCHNNKDVENAQNAHVNAVTYSPVFETPNKGETLGMAKFRETVRVYEDLDIIALGGIISQEHVNQISKTRAFGFASIRYFIK